MAKTILILGASYAGLKIAHKLLKKTLNNTNDYKVVLVAPTTHHYWNLASVRAIVPGLIPDEKIFADFRPGFKKYPESKFQFIQGAATDLNTTTKTVSIKTGAGPVSQSYDILVIATGSRLVNDGPWKQSLDGYEASLKTLHETQAKVKAAKSIVVGGAGPTGVETAAEIAFEYGRNKEVTIITSGKQLIGETVPQSVANAALNELKKLNVNVVVGTKVVESKAVGDKYEITLSNGEKKTVDLYLPTTGVIPNTEFVPQQLLNGRGEIKMDEYLRVKGVENVWAAGDVVDTEASQLAFTDKQTDALAKSLDAVIKGGSPVAYKAQGPMIAVTLGRSKATGRMGNMKLPSIMVWFIKGRTIFMENQQPLVTGSAA